MSILSRILAAFKNAFTRPTRNAQWDARFTNPPASRDGKLPLDPGRSELS